MDLKIVDQTSVGPTFMSTLSLFRWALAKPRPRSRAGGGRALDSPIKKMDNNTLIINTAKPQTQTPYLNKSKLNTKFI